MQIIPLDSSPNQTFQVTLSVNTINIQLKFFLSYNKIAEYWTMRIVDPLTDSVILDSIPLIVISSITVPNNFIWQYDYLKIGSAYLVKVGIGADDYPNETNLGTDFVLVWGDNVEFTVAQTVEAAVTLLDSFTEGGTSAQVIQLVGKPGLIGSTGPGYLASSLTSVTIGLGTQSFTTSQSILAYTSGSVCRAYHDASNFMEGTVSSFLNNILTINITRIVGSGTYSSWYFSIAADISDVIAYRDAALAAASAAQLAQSLAEDAEDDAVLAALAASNSEVLASDWATYPEGVPVPGTSPVAYSAYHWAMKAKAYAESVADPILYKGVIDCLLNPNYPAADAGYMYIISVAGKIGGASGAVVEVGDGIICNTDGTPSGDQATVGSKWNILQANTDFASPPAIGSIAPNTGAFTALTAGTFNWTAATTLTIASGINPISQPMPSATRSTLHRSPVPSH